MLETCGLARIGNKTRLGQLNNIFETFLSDFCRAGHLIGEMQSPTDAELLAEYVDRQSEAAFAQLVERHVALVHSAALRQVGDVHLAEEITQAVFIILARKADKLSPHAVLSGWLCRTAHFAARGALKIDRRRQQREQEAYMQSQLDQPTDSSRLSEATADAWLQIAPLLDGAMAQLREADRNAIVLRIYEQRPLEEVGVALGIGADAAQKRVTRALEKLRARLVKRGVTLTATVIAGAVAANSVQAASVALVQTISAVATAKGAAAGTATLTIVKGAMKIMAWNKTKLAILVCIGVLLATSTTAAFWSFHSRKDSWRSRFDIVYKLKDGEVLRYIAPPFIDERAEYYHTEETLRDQAKAVPKPPDFFIFNQDKNNELQQSSLGFGFQQRQLHLVLDEDLGFWRYEFEDPDKLLSLNLPGDWTIREGVNRETLLAALEPILLKVTGHKILFKKRTVEREVIVAHGRAKSPETKVQIYAEKKGRGGGMSSGNLQHLLGALGEQINTYVVNEAQVDPLYADLFEWTYYPDTDYSTMGIRRELLTDEVLKNLTTQMGLTFTHEQRPVDIWFITEQP